MISDQGREFLNRLNQELMKLSGTDHRITAAYHPQSNGLCERLNQEERSVVCRDKAETVIVITFILSSHSSGYIVSIWTVMTGVS